MDRIYVVAHKPYVSIPDPLYRTIQVGSGPDLEENIIRDNKGDNISELNPFYCELTALYWMWKNDNSSQNIGLVHYRRFFTTKKFSRSRRYYLSNTNVDELLSKFDIILPKKRFMKNSVENQYWMPNEEMGLKKDYQILREIVASDYKEYLEDFENFSKGHSIFYCNMFVTNRDLFNKYCEWLFPILRKVEQSVDTTSYTQQQKRIYGYLAERLFNVWVIHNKLNVCYLNVSREYLTILEELNDRMRSFACKLGQKIRVIK